MLRDLEKGIRHCTSSCKHVLSHLNFQKVSNLHTAPALIRYLIEQRLLLPFVHQTVQNDIGGINSDVQTSSREERLKSPLNEIIWHFYQEIIIFTKGKPHFDCKHRKIKQVISKAAWGRLVKYISVAKERQAEQVNPTLGYSECVGRLNIVSVCYSVCLPAGNVGWLCKSYSELPNTHFTGSYVCRGQV